VEYKNILITSTTRTGSSYIKSFFYNNGNSKGVPVDTLILTPNKNNILHLCQHKNNSDIDIDSIPDSKNWHYILSSRLDKFDQICSEEIFFCTSQSKIYHYFKFTMELQLHTIITRYKKIIETEKKWRETSSNFASFTEIFQEDLDKNDSVLHCVSKKIGFKIDKTAQLYPKIVEKSPYDKRKIILNYDDLRKKFTEYLSEKNYV
jgi:hypothetical protein